MSCCENYGAGFRLATASECSLRSNSKARIDALFGDSRSVCSSSWTAVQGAMVETGALGVCCGSPDDDQQRRVNSAVQARIEAMFASVEAESAAPGECAAALLPVKYLGAAPVGGRVASVRGLQEPLRQLLEHIQDAVGAELEVSRRGLTYRTSELHEKNNPFRRIAVWSALKLQARRRHGSDPQDVVHAFVPLVADDRAYDPGNSEDRHAELFRSMRGIPRDTDDYPPIFAVVMRRPGAARLLECHAFACRCDEDAIAAAATLYRALLADLDATARRPRLQRNGLGCASLASVVSSAITRELSPTGSRCCFEENESLPPLPPVRPPRLKKIGSASSGSIANTEDNRSCSSIRAMISADKLAQRKKKKKGSDALDEEDVLEARGRRLCPGDPGVFAGAGPDNRSSSGSSRLEQASVEKRMNAKNRVYGSSGSSCQEAVSGGLQVIESIYDGRQSRAGNDKSSSGSYDFECCTENSLYESSRIYAKACSIGQKVEGDRRSCEGSSRAPSSSTTTGSSSGRAQRRTNEPVHAEQRRRGLAGGSARYREHFRDVDEIRNLDPPYGSSRQVSRASGHQPSERSTRRLTRVDTMDRPLRQQQVTSRRRSRAGSEPPTTRTEAAAAAAATAAALKRSQSDVDLDRGDLLTRVELPRRSSFLNKPGSVRKREGSEGGGAGTPLGFTELFDEFRNQEGLTSVDDILAAIIDPEGMSFNELKPLYKEFLLKLAATLTQDELYQRSASIMRRRRRPQRRRSSRGLLRRAIKRSVSRLRSGSSGPTEFHSVIFPARKLNERSSFGSSSSCDVVRVGATPVPTGKHDPAKSRLGQTTSEDSDTCRRAERGLVVAANRSSSGYVSCSECSYDSESCTCISADKCYCSLSRRPAQPEAPALIVCSCDTDSCSESNKCYCARKPNAQQPSILEQLRQKGIVPSESTLSRDDSPDRSRRSARASRSHLATSKSLEYLKVHSPRGSADNLALDYDLFRPGARRSSQCSSGSEKVLVVSARDPQGRLIYVGGTERPGIRDGKRSSRHGQAGRHRRGSAAAAGHHEALSIKKSAEIAAVFGAGPLARLGRKTSSASSLRSSVSLEAGLGYLP
ncbi:uncharacterized protein LOC106636167 [Copidosoma floridanum]|uniref:uncharacterized protein LOC106636167 n=1 Tax=Copidosoma floridanum TaxID=29053 RepID=UPI0006C99D8F|nr:uncharacterized protein LOC106636167 [Copidosoma floridanum]